MIENQCGICQKWQERCWTVKNEESDKNSYRMDEKEEVKAAA